MILEQGFKYKMPNLSFKVLFDLGCM